MSKVLVGPILKDIEGTGLSGKETVIATAYYTSGPLSQLRINAEKVTLAVRLDFDNLVDWVTGSIDPVALLAMAKAITDKGHAVNLYAGKHAHAKMYIGEHSALIGSANMTTRGLSGVGDEVLWSVDLQGQERKTIAQGVKRYIGGMSLISIDELEKFIDKNNSSVKKKKQQQSIKSRPEKILELQRPGRLGNYSDFCKWLQKRGTVAAIEILERADGKNNLSGHIYRNFYGIRQYLIYSPKQQDYFKGISEDHYKLSWDAHIESDIARFVKNYATDEANFSLDTWKTYLPKECGGRASKHGGTIGNMNRMLPLVARYLSIRMSKVP